MSKKATISYLQRCQTTHKSLSEDCKDVLKVEVTTSDSETMHGEFGRYARCVHARVTTASIRHSWMADVCYVSESLGKCSESVVEGAMGIVATTFISASRPHY